MTRPLSLAALTVLELTPADMVSVAAEAGYDHVGLRLIPATPEEIDHGLVGDTPMRREILRRLAATGVTVLDAEIFRLREDTAVADYLPAMETAARLGTRYLLVAGNDSDERRLVERFAAFCDAAAGFGLAAVIEFMPWTAVPDLAAATRVAAAADRPNGGVLIDPFHFQRSGSRLADIAAIPAGRLPYLQFCDVPAEAPADMAGVIEEARNERRLPGEGAVDLRGLLRAVPGDAPLSLEVPMRSIAATVGALDRARMVLAATRRLLAA